jgi:hypothetical protein
MPHFEFINVGMIFITKSQDSIDEWLSKVSQELIMINS